MFGKFIKKQTRSCSSEHFQVRWKNEWVHIRLTIIIIHIIWKYGKSNNSGKNFLLHDNIYFIVQGYTAHRLLEQVFCRTICNVPLYFSVVYICCRPLAGDSTLFMNRDYGQSEGRMHRKDNGSRQDIKNENIVYLFISLILIVSTFNSRVWIASAIIFNFKR